MALSRIGKQLIKIQPGVEVVQEDSCIKVKGPKGVIAIVLLDGFALKVEDGFASIEIVVDDPKDKLKKYHGLLAAQLKNAMHGVASGFQKDLELVGVGYRAQYTDKLVLALGYSHPVEYAPPEGIKITVPSQTQIVVEGVDKQLVGEVAAKIRSFRKPEPYKGKGVRYKGEKIALKAGKAGKK